MIVPDLVTAFLRLKPEHIENLLFHLEKGTLILCGACGLIFSSSGGG